MRNLLALFAFFLFTSFSASAQDPGMQAAQQATPFIAFLYGDTYLSPAQ